MKRRLGAFSVTLLLALGLSTVTVGAATVGPIINVDGVEYQASKVTPGGTVHFETPDTNPVAAFTVRNVWVGNGSKQLPCPGGIHWIDNKNVLTISNCLEEETTTTTEQETTTTTEQVTTTTGQVTTTTTEQETTTTGQETTTTPTLPRTGTDAAQAGGLAAGLLAAGLVALTLSSRRKEWHDRH